MANAETVADFLKASPNRYLCDACLANATRIRPANQINQLVRPLGTTREYRRLKTTCSECSKDRICTAYVGPQ